jgi:predicted GIY-YIG superfamily endonuclease
MIIYILKLEGDKYYIGKSKNLESRIANHISGKGSEWTKIYKIESVVDTIVEQTENSFTELATTLHYMAKYGVDNVRGSTYSKVNLSKQEKEAILNHIRGEYDLCFNCGEDNHFVNSCPKTRLNYLFSVFSYLCGCFFRKKNTILDYTLLEDEKNIVKFGKYRGCSYTEVLDRDRGYCDWVKATESKNKEFNEFKMWLKNN